MSQNVKYYKSDCWVNYVRGCWEFGPITEIPAMQRVWEKYEKKNGAVAPNLKLLAEAALAMGVEK